MAGYVDPLATQRRTQRVVSGYSRTPVTGGNFGSFTSNLVTDYDLKPRYATVQDTQGMLGGISKNYQDTANKSIFDMVNDARAGLGAASNAALASAGQSASRMNQFASEGAAAAAGMGTDIASMRGTAASLGPYAEMLRGQGSSIYNQGLQLSRYAPQYMTAGSDILGLNRSAGGATGSYINSLLAIDPNSYVGSAASDVQSSFQNTISQLERSLSRSGVDVGSGRTSALRQRWAQAQAAAQAGAKTRARRTGLADRLQAIRDSLSVAGAMSGQGAQIAGQAAQQQATGSGVVQNAAGVVQAQGQMYGQTGQLGAQQANAYTAAGQLAQGAGNLSLGAQQVSQRANESLIQAQQVAAQYYAQHASGYGQLAGTGGLVKALFS